MRSARRERCYPRDSCRLIAVRHEESEPPKSSVVESGLLGIVGPLAVSIYNDAPVAAR